MIEATTLSDIEIFEDGMCNFVIPDMMCTSLTSVSDYLAASTKK